MFQSLDWVERLSDYSERERWERADHGRFNPSTGLSVFQTFKQGQSGLAAASFNPSTGLSVFQTIMARRGGEMIDMFQSLDWVERLSDA